VLVKTPKQFRGFWKIESMAQWDTDYIDLVVPGFLDFDDDLVGSFQFGTVVGSLDCRVRQVGAEATLEWSWEGHSDTDPGSGRGFARVEGGNLVGHIFIHQSDDSSFVAVRRTDQPAPRRKSRSTGG
jgi:hypothetical protein